MARLLAIDFDFFFPEPFGKGDGEFGLYDWGHSEDGVIAMIADVLWATRAAGFVFNDLPLPRAEVNPTEFWSRFQFSPGAEGWATDSNVHAWTPDLGVSEVWLFDAHHDSGYRPGALDQIQDQQRIVCEDWMLAYHLSGAELHVRYPQWKVKAFDIEPAPEIPLDRKFDDPARKNRLFDAVHICRSGSWVPPWCDDQFQAFLDACPVPVTWDDDRFDSPVRDFDMTAVDAMVAQTRELHSMAGRENARA